MNDFEQAFERLTGHQPFPWQSALYQRFLTGDLPSACNLPTGLGKTSIIAIWLIALAARAKVPRRLVYVVNRRTVVDQTTDEVEKIRKALLGEDSGLQPLRDRLAELSGSGDRQELPLAVSTLRGQFADNREWSANPARPAVICGTVDMIGSRLLFSGYGTGFKSKPLHAGFLGQDALLIHDEAHLEPAFQELLEAIQTEQRRGRFPDAEELQRPLHVMELTATSRTQGTPFELTAADFEDGVIRQRIDAAKQIELHPASDDKAVAGEIGTWALQHKDSGSAIIVFARTVEDVAKVEDRLHREKLPCETLTGSRRGFEREALFRSPVFVRFLPEHNRPADVLPAQGTVYLICTSAGEVGINLSADHLVCDLTTFESMAQRFGRVNRFGTRKESRIDIVHPATFGKEDKISDYDQRRQRTLMLLKSLHGNGSPHALLQLDPQERMSAFAPEPKVLPTSDILFDAWALTTIRDKLPGRPPVEKYLHGISDWEPATTQVAWREEVGIVTGELLRKYDPQELLEDYPLKPHELLQDRSDRVLKQLEALAERHPKCPAWVVNDRDEIKVSMLGELADKNKKDLIEGQTLLLSPQAGGLQNGHLNGSSEASPDIQYDVADEFYKDQDKTIQRRQRVWDDAPAPRGMRLIRPGIDTSPDLDDEDDDDDTPERRIWYWYEVPFGGDSDGSRAAPQDAITWQEHTDDVVSHTQHLVNALDLSSDIKDAVLLAARFHDSGKKRVVWQRSIGNPDPEDWHAKSGRDPTTGRLWRPAELTTYRHEFGSLLDLLDPDQANLAELQNLNAEMQDVVLHLIAVHHGYGRPHFPEDRAFDPQRSQAAADALAVEIPRRFARLQRKYGRWGLAYLESLLRAADYAASANPTVRNRGVAPVQDVQT